MPPLRGDRGDTTHVSLPRMSHWGLEIQLFDEHHCLSTSFSGTLESSAVRFSHIGEASEVQLCAETECDPTLPEWDLKAFPIFILWLVCLRLLTPPQSVPSGISQICISPVPHLPSPLSITNCRVIFSICLCIHFFIYPLFVKLSLHVFTRL